MVEKVDSDRRTSVDKDKHQTRLYFCEIRTRSIFLGPRTADSGPAEGGVCLQAAGEAVPKSHGGRVWTTAKRQIVTRLRATDHWLFITLFRRRRGGRRRDTSVC